MAEETDSGNSSDFPKVTELVREGVAMTQYACHHSLPSYGDSLKSWNV